MKVIFLKDVPKIGKKGDVKEVADGFAYNSLLPRKLALLATAENMRRAEDARAKRAHGEEIKTATLRTITLKTKESPLIISVPANAQGHLFQGLRASGIVEALKRAYGVSFEEKDVVLSAPLKEVGTHEVLLRAGDATGMCTLLITAEKK